MNTYGTRLGVIKQVLDIGYKELLERMGNPVTERSFRNYIDNKTQMPGDLISLIPQRFPEINFTWWHTGEGQVLKDDANEQPAIPESKDVFKAMLSELKEIKSILKERK
jgi:hypothetical protein